MDNNGWSEYRRLILSDLEDLNTTLKDHTKADSENFTLLTKLINEVKLDINSLKTKASIWGAVTGVVSSGIVSSIMYWMLAR